MTFPLRLNDRWRVVEDELQWIVQKRRAHSGRGEWKAVIWCQTRAGLIACIGYEVFQVGEIERDALHQLQSLPRHRLAPPERVEADQ